MKIKIIPAIDIIKGKCVRLSQGDYNKCVVYNTDPLETAKQLEDCGIKMLHLVDLDGAKMSRPKNLSVLEKIVGYTSLDIQFGGGIKGKESVDEALEAGATRVICGSTACTKPELFIEWMKFYGHDRLVFGADLKNGQPAIRGWLEEGSITIEKLLDQFTSNGLKHTIITDISKDGMLQGPAFGLYSELKSGYPELNIIASGGVSCVDDIRSLEAVGVKEVIVGKAIYEGKITLNDLLKYNI